MPLRSDVLVPPPNPLPSLAGLRIHLLGIRGRGMSPAALAAKHLGADVDGCDRAPAPTDDPLEPAGIPVALGHEPAHLADGRRLVVTMLANPDLDEVRAAADGRLHHRAELLAAIARDRPTVAVTGSHGKGTVAALVGAALEALGRDPLVVLGVSTDGFAHGFRAGGGAVVLEADDADGTIARIPATVSVVTNSWSDHPMLGRARQEVLVDVVRHAAAVPADGRVVVGRGRNLAPVVRAAHAPVWRLGADFDVETLSVDRDGRRLRYRDPSGGPDVEGTVALHVGAAADDAALAFAALRGLEVPASDAARALGALLAIRRRVEPIGEAGGVRVFDDLGKHPVSMAASLDALRELRPRRLHVVWEPNLHLDVLRWSRRWCDALAHADTAIVLPVDFRGALPSARTAPADWPTRAGSDAERAVDRADALAKVLARVRPADVVLVCGVHPDLRELGDAIVGGLSG